MKAKKQFFAICCVSVSSKTVTSFSLISNHHSISFPRHRIETHTFFSSRNPNLSNKRSLSKHLLLSSSSASNSKDNEDTLIPEENPYLVDSPDDIQSKLYPYTSLKPVLQGLHQLYPPNDLEKRNSISRTDGYWTYINNGETPPLQFTYGEFDFYFFADLLDRAHTHYKQYNQEDQIEGGGQGWQDKVFCDIGSGTGRLVMAAAALHPGWKLCRGVEILEGIHSIAIENLEKCHIDTISKKCEGTNNENNDQNVFSKGTYMEQNVNDDFMTDIMETLNSFNSNSAGLVRTDSFDEDFDEFYETEENIDSIIEDNNEDINEEIDIKASATEYALPIPTTQNCIIDQAPKNALLAPIQYTQGSFTDPYLHLSNIDIAFVFSSCMGPEILTSLSKALGRQCREGSIIITTDYPLVLQGTCDAEKDDPCIPFGEYEFEIVDQIDGYCWLVGGITTAYIHVVKKSLHDKYGKEQREKPEIPLEEQAWRIIKAKEDGTLTDTDKFLKNVYNKMMFLGCPPEWTSKLLDR